MHDAVHSSEVRCVSLRVQRILPPHPPNQGGIPMLAEAHLLEEPERSPVLE